MQVRNLLTPSGFFLSGYASNLVHGRFPRINSTSSWPKWVPQHVLTECKSRSLTLPVQVRNLQTTTFCSIGTRWPWRFTWRSILTGHTTESKSVEPADDAVFTPLWFTYGQFLECWFPMVSAKWLAESKSVSLGLRRFETYRWQLFCLPEHTLTLTHRWFPQRFMQSVLAMCLPQQNWNLILID